MSTKKHVASGLELRAQRDARLSGWPDAAQQARHHETVLLKGIGSAQESFDWIVENHAWTDLGFESVVEWWETRIRPVMVQLEMRPTAEMADKLLAKVREAERALPPAQRRTQRELAEVALVSDWKVRGRVDRRDRRSAAGADLEKGAPTGDETAAEADTLAADGERDRDSTAGSSAAGPDVRHEPAGPAVTPDHQTAPVEPSAGSQGETAAGEEIPVDSSAAAQREQQEPSEGVSEPAAPATGREVPAWLEKVSGLTAAVFELINEDPAEVADVIDIDLAAAIGESASALLTWFKAMQEALNDREA